MLIRLWIVSQDGHLFLPHTQGSEIDSVCFAGLISALESVTKTFLKGELSYFGTKNRHFTIIQHENLFFVAACTTKMKNKKIQKKLKYIADKFIESYPKEKRAAHFGDVTIYAPFEEKYGITIIDRLEKIAGWFN